MKGATGFATGAEIDRFVVESVLGQGGMATVYRVRHTSLGGEYALKILDTTRAEVAARTLQEGRVQSALRHPNVVSVIDVIDVGGQPGLVMEYVDGPSLDALIAAQGPLDLELVDHLAEGLFAGVRAAHRMGTVHRDLKPANVLLARTDRGYIPKVTDFGLAKVSRELAGTHTRTGQYMGTPSYAAPEQFKDAKSVDARADVFAVGAILYEMVTGRLAFPGEDVFEVLSALASGQVEPPSSLRPELPARMDAAILGALCKDPDDRLPDMDALEEVWRGERVDVVIPEVVTPAEAASAPADSILPSDPPVSALPAPPPEPTRRRWGLWLGAGVLVGVVAALLGVGLLAGSVALLLSGQGSVEAVPPEPVQAAPEPVAEAAPEPVVQPEPAPEPEPSPVRQPDPAPAPRPPSPEPEPEPEPEGVRVVPPPPPAPRPPAPKFGSVRVIDAEGELWLTTAAGKRVELGDRVPVGSYRLRARFAGSTEPEIVRAVGELQVDEGTRLTFKCSDKMRSCRAWP